MRKIFNLNQNWQFALQRPGMKKEELSFAEMELPHDWMISTPFCRNLKQGEAQGFFDRWGTGWYRRWLRLEKKPETFLEEILAKLPREESGRYRGLRFRVDFGNREDEEETLIRHVIAGAERDSEFVTSNLYFTRL